MVVWALNPSEHGVLKTVAQIKRGAKMQVSHEHGQRIITLDGAVDRVLLLEAIEILDCTEAAKISIEGVPVWTA